MPNTTFHFSLTRVLVVFRIDFDSQVNIWTFLGLFQYKIAIFHDKYKSIVDNFTSSLLLARVGRFLLNHVKNHSNYPVSADIAEIHSAMREMAEGGETKLDEFCHKNAQSIETLII